MEHTNVKGSDILKKGFTLIELLAVIVILGLLAVVTISAATKLFETSKEKAYNLMIQDIENASKEYVKIHKDILENLTTINPVHTIHLSNLVSEFLIDSPVNNPLTNTEVKATETTIDIRLVTTGSNQGDVTYTVNIQ